MTKPPSVKKDCLRAGAPALAGFDPATVYTAASDWLKEIAAQLTPEATPCWSPNLLFESTVATVIAARHGLPPSATTIVMGIAWSHLGAVAPTPDRPDRLTSPDIDRGVTVSILRWAADNLDAIAGGLNHPAVPHAMAELYHVDIIEDPEPETAESSTL